MSLTEYTALPYSIKPTTMKRILLVLLLALCATTGFAQPSLSSRITTTGVLNKQYYIWDTGFRRGFALKLYNMLDSLHLYDSLLNAAVTSAGDLAAVTGLGNTTTTSMKVYNSGAGYETIHSYAGVSTNTYPSSDGRTFLGVSGGISQMNLRDGANYYAKYYPSSLTADRIHYAPDEGGTYVTHVTKDSIVVGSMSSANATTTTGAFKIRSASSILAQLNTSVGSGYLDLKDGTSSYFTTYWGVPYTGSLTANRNLYAPNTTGTIATRRDTIGDALSDAPYFATLYSAPNLSNGTRTFTGSYTHNVMRYNVGFDSTNIWTIKDTGGKYLLNLNDTANYSNSIGYISNRGDKRISLKSANGLGEFFLINTTTNNLSKLKAGSAILSGSQASGICNVSVVAGASSEALMQVDSSTKSVNVNHLSGIVGTPSISAGTGAGTLPTVSVTGDDLGGYITIATGTSPATSSIVATITFNQAYSTAPRCIIIQGANSAASSLSSANFPYVDQSGITTTTFDLTSKSVALAGSTTYKFYYFIKQ